MRRRAIGISGLLGVNAEETAEQGRIGGGDGPDAAAEIGEVRAFTHHRVGVGVGGATAVAAPVAGCGIPVNTGPFQCRCGASVIMPMEIFYLTCHICNRTCEIYHRASIGARGVVY